MKTEDFDDAIKRKLESINPVFDEKDIDRVHQYTIRNRGPFSLLRTNRFLWSVMGAAVVATAVLTWKITTMYEQNHAVSQQVAIQNNTQVLHGVTQPKIITKTDTVYIPKTANAVPDQYSSYKAFNENSKTASANKVHKQYSATSNGKLYASGKTTIDPKINSS